MKKSVFNCTLVFALFISTHAHANDGSQLAEKVYTVKEFTENIEFAKEVDEKCRNNPGELGDDPNCVNAREAVAKDRLIGSGDKDSFKSPSIN
ncbi:EexN family lipoprotein [Halomonas alimentaria]|uniref:EexN family lipoprotein n=1 Tax=Halomonas alimentaria TaxID=147248 RepID=UPI002491E145|nr:EexN family lipoprotein [Halomonas alimentaria]